MFDLLIDFLGPEENLRLSKTKIFLVFGTKKNHYCWRIPPSLADETRTQGIEEVSIGGYFLTFSPASFSQMRVQKIIVGRGKRAVSLMYCSLLPQTPSAILIKFPLPCLGKRESGFCRWRDFILARGRAIKPRSLILGRD